MKLLSKENLFSFFLITAILIPIALIKLGSFPIRLWDESMFSVNSYEMLQRNEFIVPYFNGEMNLWNSKPPLVLWMQMISIKLFDFNELAVRLPSALSTISCALLLFYFLKKHMNATFAWIAILVLTTAQGFFTFHTGRTADTDAVLTFFLTAANLLFIDTIIENKITTKRLLLFFILLTLAFLCKSFAAILFSAGYLIILLVKRKELTQNIFLNPSFYIGLLIFTLTAVSFILLRNNLQPGYIDFIFSVDLGRYTKEIEEHKGPFSYYLEHLSNYSYKYWFFLSMIGIVMIFQKNINKNLHSILLFSSVLLLSYLLIISTSVSKLPWYTMPLYPLMSILAAAPIYFIIQSLSIKKSLQSLLIVMLFIYPYTYSFGISQSNAYIPNEGINEASEQFIFNEINNNKYTDGTYVLHTGFTGGLKFYEYKLKEQKLKLFIEDKIVFPDNSIVVVSRDSLKQKLKTRYNCILIDSMNYTCKYKVYKR